MSDVALCAYVDCDKEADYLIEGSALCKDHKIQYLVWVREKWTGL